MNRMWNKEEIIKIAEEHGGSGSVLIDDNTIKKDADNKLYVNDDVIATVDYVDDSVTGLVAQSELEEALEEKQDVLTAGDGINIGDNDEISVKVGRGLFFDANDQVQLNDASYNAIQAVPNKLDASKCTFQTTAPTEAISDGGVHIVSLSSEPATKYSGYIYLIAEE